MRVIQKILLTFAMVFGLSLAISAQKEDPKKPPPKGTPPVVNPQPKPPPQDKPKKPDKPEFSFVLGTTKSTEAA